MKRSFVISTGIVVMALFWQVTAWGQTEDVGYRLNREAKDIETKAQSKADLERAIKKYEEALAEFEKAKSEKGKGIALNNIGAVYNRLGQYSKALEYYEKSLPIRQKIGHIQGEGTTLCNIGAVYNKLGQYSKALEYYEKSLEIDKKIDDAKGQGITLNNIGLVYESLGQYGKALEYYERSLEIDKKIGDIKGEGTTLNNIGAVYDSLAQYSKALEYYERSLPIRQKMSDVKGEGTTLNNIGLVYQSLGQYSKALEHFEKSFTAFRKIGDVKGQGITLNNIGLVYNSFGQYNKALKHFEKSLEIRKKIGDVEGEATTTNNIGAVYQSLGQYSKSLEYYEKSLPIFRKIGDVKSEGTNLNNIGVLYAQQGKYQDAIRVTDHGLAIQKKIGIPTEATINLIANYYLDASDLTKAEPLVKKAGYNSTAGRLALLKSDYPLAATCYAKSTGWAEKTGNADMLFTSYTGLGKAYEGIKDYKKAEEFYGKAIKVTEEIRDGLIPAERKNFFEVKIGGFQRSDPAKGLTRVRMKLNNPEGSIVPSELTKARSFSDHLSVTNASSTQGLPAKLQEKEQSLVTQLAVLKKDLEKTDSEKYPEKHQSLRRLVIEAKDNLNGFIEELRKEYPAYVAVKYPKPISLKDSALKPNEYVLLFDVSNIGVALILCADEEVKKSFYLDVKKEDLEKEIRNFREPIQKVRFKQFDIELARSLYNRFLRDALTDVPTGAPLIIIPDGILAMLPFECLVVGGDPVWASGALNHQYPAGLTYLVDEHPISYYPSLTALTLSRTFGSKNHVGNKILVVADPVFSNKDARVQKSPETKIPENEKKYNIELMQAVEDSLQGELVMGRLKNTLLLAQNLEKTYGSDCQALTGLKANKSDFMTEIAPHINVYSNIVFATHGVMSTKIPGLMEPFLALTMAPPGTDGFLKMSDILTLEMNSDIVALTACQTGLGKDVSGEGVMSMGRAFQYAGAKSVLMTLWEVEELSAVKMTERFFQHRKDGKTKLQALHSAREDIKNEGYGHPLFWSGFILVGESD